LANAVVFAARLDMRAPVVWALALILGQPRPQCPLVRPLTFPMLRSVTVPCPVSPAWAAAPCVSDLYARCKPREGASGAHWSSTQTAAISTINQPL
jgi:hypothetical protein